ncbi:YGL010w-like protein, partial [Quillaja saponaria]
LPTCYLLRFKQYYLYLPHFIYPAYFHFSLHIFPGKSTFSHPKQSDLPRENLWGELDCLILKSTLPSMVLITATQLTFCYTRCLCGHFYSALLFLLYFTPPLFSSPQIVLGRGLVFNYGFLVSLIYALFYVRLDKKVGSLAALLTLLCWVGSNVVASRLGFSLARKIVLVSQLLGWTGQFIGHWCLRNGLQLSWTTLFKLFYLVLSLCYLRFFKHSLGMNPMQGSMQV